MLHLYCAVGMAFHQSLFYNKEIGNYNTHNHHTQFKNAYKEELSFWGCVNVFVCQIGYLVQIVTKDCRQQSPAVLKTADDIPA